MFDKFGKYFYQNFPFSRDQIILVGVSGGPDSLALMSLLVEAGQKIVVAHVNHQIRPEADEEEKGVIRLSEKLGLPCITSRVAAIAFAKQESLSLEEAARILRYRFLFREAEKNHAVAVAVGHNADDQVETFLLHLLRGSGVNGLRGMKSFALPNAWSSQIPLIRPLLGIWRSEILDYLSSKGIRPFWDRSNWDNQYTRNRIRNELIPMLEGYNPAIRKLIWQTCAVLNSDLEILEKLEQDFWKDICLHEDENSIEFDLVELKKNPLSMQRRIVRRAWLKLTRKPEEIDYEHLCQITAWINQTLSGKRELDTSVTWFNESKNAWIIRKGFERRRAPFPQLLDKAIVSLTIPGRTKIGGEWWLKAEIIENKIDEPWKNSKNEKKWEAWIDLNNCRLPLLIRTFQAGDRIDPFGLGGAQVKVSDIFVNRKIPYRFRQFYPLICDTSRIIWLPGYTISEAVRITDQTQKILHLLIEREMDPKNVPIG